MKNECPKRVSPTENTCRDMPNPISNLIGGICREAMIRLAKKGLFPMRSDLGFMYAKDVNGQIVGTAIDHTGEDLANQPVTPNEKLTRIEYLQLKSIGLLLSNEREAYIRHIKNEAKLFRKDQATHYIYIAHGEALNAVAQLRGYKNYQHLLNEI